MPNGQPKRTQNRLAVALVKRLFVLHVVRCWRQIEAFKQAVDGALTIRNVLFKDDDVDLLVTKGVAPRLQLCRVATVVHQT